MDIRMNDFGNPNPNPIPVIVPGEVQNLVNQGLRNRNQGARFNPFLDHLPEVEELGAIQHVWAAVDSKECPTDSLPSFQRHYFLFFFVFSSKYRKTHQ